ncbi:MAG: DUF3341 domain-containing protein [Deltaproteobacteria bacterium]|nr:DUF3341 domain-containing protein [Deltaproteobacteria bacterium]
MAEKKVFGLLAEFDSAQSIYPACEAVRDEGFKHWDAHVPFPVHGLDRAMGLGPSKVPWIVLGMGLLGATLGFTLEWWTMVVEYPTPIAGKPFFSWPAFVPVTFELGVLFASLGAVFGMFGINRMPTFHHPLFSSERFGAFSDDKFFISIEARDPLFDERKTKKLLKKLGATHIEEVMEE